MLSRKSFLVFVLFAFYSVQLTAQTNVSGNVQGTWTKALSPYRLNGKVIVPAGQLLTVEPGVVIQFFASELNVQGTLIAEGLASDSIKFNGLGTPYANGALGPITIEATSTNSSFKYVKINGLGFYNSSDYTPVFVIRSSSCTVENSSLQYIRGTGIYFDNASPRVNNNSFSVENMDVISNLDDLTGLTGSVSLKVGILPGMTKDATLYASNFYYELLTDFTVPLSRTLTIQPGVVLIFPFNLSKITVRGTLVAEGTATDSIKLIGLSINKSNGPESRTGPVMIEASSINSSFKYVLIEGLGYYYNNDLTSAMEIRSSSCNVQHSTIRKIKGTGIRLDNAYPQISDNTFSTTNLDLVLSVDNLSRVSANTPLKVGILQPMTTDATLARGNLFYKFLNSLIVPQGKTLTIDPGVQIQFPYNTSEINVQGTLKAEGTVTDSIRLTGVNEYPQGQSYPSNKKGPIVVEAVSLNSSFKYVAIDGLGYDNNRDFEAAVVIRSATCIIQNSSLRNIRASGINVDITNPLLNNFQPQVINNSFSTTNMDVLIKVDNQFRLSGNGALKIGIASGMTADARLTKSNLYYKLVYPLIIPAGRTLTIDPGTELMFPFSNGLAIQGTLIAEGTANDSIRFTTPPLSYGNSTGRIFADTGSVNSSLKFIKLTGFGTIPVLDSRSAIILRSSSFTLENCSLQNITGSALEIEGRFFPRIANNSFTTSTLDVIAGLDQVKLFSGTGNGSLKIGLITLDMNTDDTLSSEHIFYRLLRSQTVRPGRILTIQPGVRLEFPLGASFETQLTVQGTLLAKGTADNYVRLIGVEGRYPSGAQRGPITVEASSLNSSLQYVVIDSMGYYNPSLMNAVLVIRSTSCTLNSVIILNSRGIGLSLQNTGSMVITKSCFYNNFHGAVLSNGGNPAFVNCNFSNNYSFGINNTSTSSTDIINAENCWWGNVSGPNHYITNTAGMGDIVSDKVIYSPWSSVQFDCGSTKSPLPLTLTDFKITLISDNVQCSWQTSSEVNTNYFVVQRSKENNKFADIGKVKAAGNASGNLSYQFTDAAPGSGINYYRLQMFDKDGAYSYSKVLAINIDIKAGVSLFPNPAKENLFVQIQNHRAEKLIVQIIDLQGKIVHQQTHQMQMGTTTISFNTTGLAKGLYILNIKGLKMTRKTFVKD